MYFVVAFVSGLVFGVGLLVSGMVNPDKVLSFLDLAGNWDPSLALVMVGAIAVGMVAFYFAQRRGRSILGCPMPQPSTNRIDPRCVIGSLAFGVGWGLVGFCPAPALAVAGIGEPKALAFVAAMLSGMYVYELLQKRNNGDN